MPSLENRVAAIEDRNRRVEADKAWETSWTRRVSIALMTYGLIVGFLFFIDNDAPLINGLVPVAGFLLSTLILKSIRAAWEKR